MEVIKLPRLPADLTYDRAQLSRIVKVCQEHNIGLSKRYKGTAQGIYAQHQFEKSVEFKQAFDPFDYESVDLESRTAALCYRFEAPEKSYLRACFTETVQDYFTLPEWDVFENVYFDSRARPERVVLYVNNRYYELTPMADGCLFPSDFWLPVKNITKTQIVIILPPGAQFSCTFVGGYFNHYNPRKLVEKPFKKHGFTVKSDGSCIYRGSEITLGKS